MIEIRNVSKIYPNGFRAVDGLSLSIPKGDLVVFIGPSGCGKTTTMRMINRLIAISTGEILIEGRNNQEIPAEELRRNIGYAIQQIGLFPHMTVSQNIATVPRLLEWDEGRIRRRVDELLELVGLDPDLYRDKFPRQLSGGQQQRVGVARALGADPPIMLMDEPFGAVDPITREILQDEFIQIQHAVEKTIVFVTHDIDEAIKMGDRIAILRDGKLVQYDTPETLLEKPNGRFVRDFVGADRQLKRLGLVGIRELLDKQVVRVYMDATAAQAKEVMEKNGVRSVFVVERETDILRGWVNKEALEVADSLLDAMHEAPYSDIAVRERATAREALSAMVARGFRVTPVVNREGRLVGTIRLEAIQELAIYNPVVPPQALGEATLNE
ncbi:MAG: betaine/proline/choline family ABC transporter ATP-binding protein [Anaerolineales bacterium]|nr:betaine/proline/choline family ABC transporter ATP-binding protein [Anaerolineales bacterium]